MSTKKPGEAINPLAKLGSFLAKWSKWNIDIGKWFEFLNSLRKEDVMGLSNKSRVIANGNLMHRLDINDLREDTSSWEEGMEIVMDQGMDYNVVIVVERKPDGLYLDGQKIGLLWYPEELRPIGSVSWDQFLKHVSLQDRKLRPVALHGPLLEFLLENQEYIPDDWKLCDRNGNQVNVMFTGTVYKNQEAKQFIRGLYFTDRFREVWQYKDSPSFYINSAIAIRQELHARIGSK